jgi:hypothetical protein
VRLSAVCECNNARCAGNMQEVLLRRSILFLNPTQSVAFMPQA